MAPVKKPAANAKNAKAVKPIETRVETSSETTSVLKTKDLVERVVAATDLKKKDAKGLVDAVLAELGNALDKGEELNLPGFGRVKVVKTVEKGEVNQLTLKLKRIFAKVSDNNDKKPLAEDDE